MLLLVFQYEDASLGWGCRVTDMDAIRSFTGHYRFLSNFYPVDVLANDGYVYPSVEHAYQAAKTTDDDFKLSILAVRQPGEAKSMGRVVLLRPDWESIKLAVMHSLLTEKFSEPEMRRRLLATEDALLIEGNNWGDNFWGADNSYLFVDKQNWLGRLLMLIRSQLQWEK